MSVNRPASQQIMVPTLYACSNLGWMCLPCFGHNFLLAVQNAVKNETRVSRALGICRKLVRAFLHSWKKKET